MSILKIKKTGPSSCESPRRFAFQLFSRPFYLAIEPGLQVDPPDKFDDPPDTEEHEDGGGTPREPDHESCRRPCRQESDHSGYSSNQPRKRERDSDATHLLVVEEFPPQPGDQIGEAWSEHDIEPAIVDEAEAFELDAKAVAVRKKCEPGGFERSTQGPERHQVDHHHKWQYDAVELPSLYLRNSLRCHNLIPSLR